MIKVRLSAFKVLIFSMCLLLPLVYASNAVSYNGGGGGAGSNTVAWQNTPYGTTAFGATWLIGQFGANAGAGGQGIRYQYMNPIAAAFMNYPTTVSSMGFGSPFSGYRSMFSPVAASPYGLYAGGMNPNIQMSSGSGTSGGYMFGNMWGLNPVSYQTQYNPMAGLTAYSHSGGVGINIGSSSSGGYAGGGYAAFDDSGGLTEGGYGLGGFGMSSYGNTSGYGFVVYDGDVMSGYGLAVYTVTP